MEHDPKIPKYSTGDKTSFGYITVRDRWPVIITGVIDDTYRTMQKTEGEKFEQGKVVLRELTTMKYEIQHDRELTPIPNDNHPDVEGYNTELSSLPSPTTWYNVPWLYAECYFYRRIHAIYTLSTLWKSHDPFARQKLDTFRSSRTAVLELASHFRSLVPKIQEHVATASAIRSAEETAVAEQAERLLFREMVDICLWGNATDLSLLTTLSYEELQALQGKEARQKSEEKILVNDVDAVYDVLKAAAVEGKRERRIDIILDNAGFELYVDLVMAAYLLEAGLATEVVLHPKRMPWFVSDVVAADFGALLSVLADPRGFYEGASGEGQGDGGGDGVASKEKVGKMSEKEVGDLVFLFQRLSGYHGEGRMVLRPNDFWTEGGGFWRMPAQAGELVEDLRGAVMTVWKGDLNYRKLTGDAMWPPMTPFTTALGPLGPGSGIPILALRTCKADVVVGLEEGVDEKLRALEGGGGDSGQRRWCWSGKWAVVSFSSG